MASKLAPLPNIELPWIDSQGRPTQAFYRFMVATAANNVGPFTSATDDTAAAQAGVPINGLYQSSGAVRIRLT